MVGQVKVLTFGDVRGQFEALNKRIATYNNKAGPFEVVFCVGEFFSEENAVNEDLLLGKISAPCVPVYVVGASSETTAQYYPAESAEIAENITYLGARGQLNLACGLRIAFLSGTHSPVESSSSHFTEESVSELLVGAMTGSNFAGVDILLTSEWPSDVHRYVTSPPSEPVDGSPLISRVATMLRPRYHFSALHNVYYERQPYRNHRVLQDPAAQNTRFVACAQLGNKEKKKFVYAFNITPMEQLSKAQLTEQVADVGEYPYAQCIASLATKKRDRDMDVKNDKTQYFFDQNPDMNTYENEGSERKRNKRGGNMIYDDTLGGAPPKQRAPAGPCWFCLSSPEVEKHMIACIGDCCYVALPKGPLNGAHMLVMPVGHIQSLVVADEAVRQEMRRFRQAIRKCFREVLHADTIFFERNYRTQHMQLNCVGVPKGCDVAEVFKTMATTQNITLHTAGEGEAIWDVIGEGAPYLAIYLNDDTLLYTRHMQNFPLQFAREVMCAPGILDKPDRVDWRTVKMDKQEEIGMVETFKENFDKWDFTKEE